ncbi:MAG: fibronectin type III domain-containing protein [Moraxellaceae bacterium]|nr:fibronectin type III domain-containing protein [Pseudobdellovibrionaceae bacterium]
MKTHFIKIFGRLSFFIFALYLSGCDGKAEVLSTGTFLGDPSLNDGGTRTDGSDQGQIYTVTNIIEATNEIPEWSVTDLPFTGPRRNLGVNATDSQWPFKYTFTYPPNNYILGEARLLIATSRDSSDTEGIFVDGVFTGRPPASFVSANSPQILYRHYSCAGCSGATLPNGPANIYYMQWALDHYKINTVNTFDLNLNDLINTTPLTITNMLSDGILRVVSGDDAVIQTDTATASRPLLITEGFTISKTPLTCLESPVYKISNEYIHADGNSISNSAFTGTVLSPFNSWSTPYSTFRSVEFFYDVKLPKLNSYANLNTSFARITMNMKRTNSGSAAMVINGIGIDQDVFDRTLATAAVESWSSDPAARSYWNSFITAIPADNLQYTVTLDLVSLLGATKVKELLLQGKLNIAFAGPVANIYGQNNSSARAFGAPVNGPSLVLNGNYSTQICAVPDNPGSSLNGGSVVPTDCLTDFSAPIVSSIQVTSITSTSASIQWLTNEGSSSRVGYGVSTPSTVTSDVVTPVTFHSVKISGLQPYKFYQYNVRSTDACSNQTTSPTKSFRTLR